MSGTWLHTSPYLFNLYGYYILTEAGLEEDRCHFKIEGRSINYLLCSDVTSIIDKNAKNLQGLPIKVKNHNEKMELKENMKKTNDNRYNKQP